MPIGMPGCPDFAASTASIDKARIALANSRRETWAGFGMEDSRGGIRHLTMPRVRIVAESLRLVAKLRLSRGQPGMCAPISCRGQDQVGAAGVCRSVIRALERNDEHVAVGGQRLVEPFHRRD